MTKTSDIFFRQIRLPDIGCASYLIGGDGVCAVIDPRWDAVRNYIGLARSTSLEITHIIETHVHADHVSGATRLAARTGARILIHRDAVVSYPHEDVEDGDVVEVGPVRLTVLHTPGHSADSISLLVADRLGRWPESVLTGDTLFTGDVGRPDLHGDAAETLASNLYDSLHERLMSLSDDVIVYPGHLAGSLCGKKIAPDPSTTIGRERADNGALAIADRLSFVREIIADLPPRPPNIDLIVSLNRSGAPAKRPKAAHVEAGEFSDLPSKVAIIDGRDYAEFSRAHLQGALNVPVSYGQFGLMVSWLVSPERPLLLITADDEDLGDAIDSLMVLGMTNPLLVLEPDPSAWQGAGLHVEDLELLTPAELRERIANGQIGTIIDVRETSELGGGSIERAINIPYRALEHEIPKLCLLEPVVVVCNSGNRSAVGSSLLVGKGIRAVNLAGGTTAWEEAGYPLDLI